MATKTKLEMFRGDTFKWDLAVTQGGSPVDITGWVLWMTAKLDPLTPDASAQFKKQSPSTGITITSAVGGLARITVDPADTTSLTDTTTLFFDVQGKESGGAIHTLASGTLKVLVDVTVATT